MPHDICVSHDVSRHATAVLLCIIHVCFCVGVCVCVAYDYDERLALIHAAAASVPSRILNVHMHTYIHEQAGAEPTLLVRKSALVVNLPPIQAVLTVI
jgi:hypothetical protein